MTLRARSCVAALVTVGLALHAESAHADVASAGAAAPPICQVMLSNSKSIVLPANAPALIVVNPSYGQEAPTLDAALVSGTTETDLVAGTDVHGLLTVSLPTPSVGAGTYDVDVTSTCPWMNDTRNVVVPLTLTAPVAFPTSVGTLVVERSNPPTGVDKVRLEPTDSMRAFLPAASLELSVNGAKKIKSQLISETATIQMPVNTGDACIENGELHRDKRVVKVTVEGFIAGLAEAPAAASADVEIDCGAIKWTSGIPEGTSSTNPPTTSGGSSGSTTSSSSSSASNGDGGGCSAAPTGTHGGTSGLAAFALGGLALVAMRRRRRA